jgi:L-iditol 2-dehydrogenase
MARLKKEENKMKAAVFEALDKMTVKEVPDPVCKPDGAVVRVKTVAVCGSDIRIFHHGNPRVKPPAVIGHEASGKVVEVGENVDWLKPGDRVAIGADVPCGKCRWCQSGLGNNCEINYAIGYQIPGVFAEFMELTPLVVGWGPVTKFSDNLSWEEAALAEPLACAINGLELCRLSAGQSVVIMGAGPIGCMMIDLARHMGATKVIVTQRSRPRLEFAKQFAADVYISSGEEDVVARCREETEGEGPDVVVTTCGSVEAHEQAIEMVRHRGVVNLFGGLAKGTRNLSVPSNTIHYKECFVTGSHGCVPRHHRTSVEMIEKGYVRVKELVTHRFALDEIGEAFKTAESHEGMKVVVTP